MIDLGALSCHCATMARTLPTPTPEALQHAADEAWAAASAMAASTVPEYAEIGIALKRAIVEWAADTIGHPKVGQAAAAAPATVAAVAGAAAALYALLKIAGDKLRKVRISRKSQNKPDPKAPDGTPHGPWFGSFLQAAGIAAAGAGALGLGYGAANAPAGSWGSTAITLIALAGGLYVASKVL